MPKWWMVFNDPILNRLVERVQHDNLDIQTATLRLQEAKISAQTPRASWWPSISLVGSASRGNLSSVKDASISRFGIQGQWTLDFSGEIESQVKAADARVAVQAAALDDARQEVITALVEAMIRWRESRMILDLTAQQLQELETQAQMHADLASAGLADGFPEIQVRSKQRELEAKYALLEAEATRAMYQIEQLVGATDNAVVSELAASEPVQIQLPEFQSVVSEDITALQQRPDVREARALVLESEASLAQAESQLWPEVTLGGLYQIQSVSDGVFQNGAQVWSLSADINYPLFNFGALQSVSDAAGVRQIQAVKQYESTLRKALQSVRTALANYTQAMTGVTAWQASEQAQRRGLFLARDQFSAGFTNYIAKSLVEIDYLQTRIGATQQYGNAARAYVAIQRELGVTR